MGADSGKEGVPLSDDVESAAAMQEKFPVFVDTLWRLTVADIETTLQKVCYKVLKDMSVDKDFRLRRAQALQVLGTCFQKAALMEKTKSLTTKNAGSSTESDGTNNANAKEDGAIESHKSRFGFLRRFGNRTNRDERKEQAMAISEQKKRRMEEAIAMMAAGATTDDIG